MALAFDGTSGHASTATGSSSPLAVTVTVVAGETYFCVVSIDASSIGSVSVSGITGGGTWTKVVAVNAAASSRVEIWATGVNASTTASSISVAITGTITAVAAAVGAYTGVGSILSANAVTAVGTTLSPATVSLTTTTSLAWVLAGMACVGSTPAMTANTGTIRETADTSALSVALLDNNDPAPGSSVTAAVTISAAHTDWAAAAVELEAAAPTLRLGTSGNRGATPALAGRLTSNNRQQTQSLRSATAAGGGVMAFPVSLSVIPSAFSLGAGLNFQLQAALLYSNGFDALVTSNPAVTWSSSNTGVATVSSAGLVTAVSAGSASISATYAKAGQGSFTGSSSATITAAVLEGVVISPVNPTVTVGSGTLDMDAMAVYSNGSQVDVTTSSAWTSGTPAAATVGASTGVVTAVAAGTTLITASYSGFMPSTTVTVAAAPPTPVPTLTGLLVTPQVQSVPTGSTQQFSAWALYSNGTATDVTATTSWTSSVTSVASIGSSSGILTGISTGSTVVSGAFGGLSASSAVTVSKSSGTATIPKPGAAMTAPKPTSPAVNPKVFTPIHTTDPVLTLVQANIAAALKSLSASPVVSGGFQAVTFPTASTTDSSGTWSELMVQHGLGTASPQFFTGNMNAPASVYVSPNNSNPAMNPSPSKQTLLRTNVPGVQVSLWFYGA